MGKFTDVLKQVLGSLSIEDIIELNEVAVQKQYPEDVVVCQEGELEHTFYVIESGLVSVSRSLNDGTEQVLGVLRDGQFFGEMGLLDDVPRAATVRTLTACTLIEISEETFDAIVTRNPGVAVTLLKGITRSLRDTDKIAIAELELSNQELARALNDLKAAQAELLAQARLKRDIEIAASVQRSILPAEFPRIEGFEFAVQAQPAREVGGDFYDVFEIGAGCFALVVADVSGKSVQAAIFMALVRALLLREAADNLSPAETMHRLHTQLMKTTSAEMFVTMFYGIVNTKTRHMAYVRAGHERPILYRAATHTLELLNPAGQFIGLWPDLVVEEAEIILASGDCLVCYSDGVIDSADPRGRMFGLDKLLALVKTNGGHSARQIAAQITTSLTQFQRGAPPTDDITLLITKVA